MLVVIASAGLAVGVAGCGSGGPQQEAARFLETYARPDGRVVRLDQGHDTVSEGQAYGMLLAEVSGDATAFQRIWTWTRQHLQLRNHLFAFHANAAGQLISTEPASDADLLIAWALVRYQGPHAGAWHRDGREVADAVLAHEVTTGPGGLPVLAAGPWAVGQPSTIDPSYWSLAAFQGLAKWTGNHTWLRLEAGAVDLARKITRNGNELPPDWALLHTGDAPQPAPSPGGNAPAAQYGLDAQRTVVWFAASCNPQARALAARWWPLLRHRRSARALTLGLNGAVLSATHAPLPLVAAAAAARAAGHSAESAQLLGEAAAQQRHFPTYYGGAWSALGQALLTSDALGPCLPAVALPAVALPAVALPAVALAAWRAGAVSWRAGPKMLDRRDENSGGFQVGLSLCVRRPVAPAAPAAPSATRRTSTGGGRTSTGDRRRPPATAEAAEAAGAGHGPGAGAPGRKHGESYEPES